MPDACPKLPVELLDYHALKRCKALSHDNQLRGP